MTRGSFSVSVPSICRDAPILRPNHHPDIGICSICDGDRTVLCRDATDRDMVYRVLDLETLDVSVARMSCVRVNRIVQYPRRVSSARE